MDRQGKEKYFAMPKWWRSRKDLMRFLIFFGLIILFAFTRLWKLTSLPHGVHIDEASMAYSAWSLAEYGVDRYLNPWPIYVANFEGGHSAMYVYICAGLFKIFGYHLCLIRIPAVFFSFLNLIFGMLTARKVFPKNDIIPLTVGGMIVVCPYFIMAGRFGLDCNLMLGVSTIFLYCFICAIESEKISRYILAGVTGGLVLYTYALSYLALPIFLLFALVYVIRIKRFYLKRWIAMAIPMGMLAVPLILVQIVNIFDLAQFQIGCFTVTKMGANRAVELGGSISFEKLYDVFKVIFFGDDLIYNTAPGFANCYGVTIAFFFLGADSILRSFWRSIRDRKSDSQTFLLLWLISMVLLGTMTSVKVHRINGIFYCVIFFAAVGVDVLGMMLKKYSAVIVAVVSGIYLVCFGKFANYYYGGTYVSVSRSSSNILITEAINFIEQDSVLRNKTTQMVEPGIYYALSTLKSPYELNMRVTDEEKKMDNYIFGSLGAIEDQYNYIVGWDFAEYSEELRMAGFMEECYGEYSLFYKK